MFDGRCGRIPAVDGPIYHYDESHLLLTPGEPPVLGVTLYTDRCLPGVATDLLML